MPSIPDTDRTRCRVRTAILMSAPLDPTLGDRTRAGQSPQHDFLGLAEALDAEIIAPLKPSKRKERRVLLPLKFLRIAWAAYTRRGTYDVVLTDLEHTGLTLALLFKMARVRKRHVMICHGKIIKKKTIAFMKAFGLAEYVDRFVCYGPNVADRLRSALDLPADRVATVRHAVDHNFWRPLPVPAERLVVSAGMLKRDYPTLVEAMRGLDVSAEIAAFSPWVRGAGPDGSSLPANVHFTRLSPTDLRALYARARLIAIPLEASNAQSGSLVIYESLAMGKPVVVTRTVGQGALEIIREGETGFYTEPGDVRRWREIIQYLCDNPTIAERMGRAARAVVENGMNMDTYVRDVAAIVRDTAGAEAPVLATAPEPKPN